MRSYTEKPAFRALVDDLRPDAVYEHRFHPRRRWRFDVAWIDDLIAVEIDGGVWTRGRHSRGAGQVADNEKINTAQSLGWRVYRFTPGDVKSGVFAAAMRAIFAGEEYPCELKKGA